MEVDFPYSLSDDDAKARLEILGRYLTNKHGIKVTWTGPQTATFNGKYLVVKIEGELKIGNGKCSFKGHDPGWPWRKKAEDYVRGKIATYLDPKAVPSELPTGEQK